MNLKESSDEFNPAIITADSVPASPGRADSLKHYTALAVATCGVGYFPLAPGTWGSLLAVGFYLLIRFALLPDPTTAPLDAPYPVPFLILQLAIIVLITVIGIWAASYVERVLQIKDPGKVVVDEVAGQFVALSTVPLVVHRFWTWVIAAFLLFRFFDIVKPYPARRLEALHGGRGIMLDDLVAGAYAAIIVELLIVISFV